MAELQKSKSWDQKNHLKGDYPISGFPFKESFPRRYRGVTFTLITRNGAEHKGVRVDDSRQYAAEGLEWRGPTGKSIDRYLVVCWIEEETKS